MSLLNNLYLDRTNGFLCLHLCLSTWGAVGLKNISNYHNSLLLTTHTSSFPDVWFSLRNTTHQNNSLVTLEDIGENDTALLCKTNQTACCPLSHIGNTWLVLGNWFYPNETRVLSLGNNTDFYRTREQMEVLLHRRRGGEDGIYRCEIPDLMDVTQTIYIGVYTANTSTGE